jgi:ubiquinone biosynthesis protein Coq4
MNEDKTPREILNKFYADHNLEADGGQSKPYVKIDVTPKFHFYIPNFDARRKAVIKHDIHHLLTGYETTVAGESEISAWEVASGCKSYWAAFLIDVSGAMLGILFNFFGVLKAFARGRRTKNLYYDTLTTEQALDMKIGDLRKEFGLDKHPKDTKPTFTDFILFMLFVFFGGIYSLCLWIFLPFIIFYTIYIEIKSRNTPVK